MPVHRVAFLLAFSAAGLASAPDVGWTAAPSTSEAKPSAEEKEDSTTGDSKTAGPKSGKAATKPPAGVLPSIEVDDSRVAELLEKLVPARSDAPYDWLAPRLDLAGPGEPRLLSPCVPPAPCHPAYPPWPLDLIGVAGAPTCGPRYRGPCEPRLGSHDSRRFPRLHAACDAAFDAFYR
jgi:hypothetical protein